MKITAKMTKDTLVNILRTNYKSVKAVNSNLAERIAYTCKSGKATRKDLVDITKEVMTVLGDKFKEVETPAPTKAEKPAEKPVKAKAENSVKKAAKVEAPAEKTEEVKTKKKSEPKKSDGVTDLGKENVQFISSFPNSIEIDGEVYEIAHDIETMEDLLEGEYEFAFYWTKKHLRQFDYFNGWLGQPKSFPNDLDTAQLIYVSDEGKVAYCVSDSTEAPYTILPEDLEEVDGVRISSGNEFQIYRRKADK